MTSNQELHTTLIQTIHNTFQKRVVNDTIYRLAHQIQDGLQNANNDTNWSQYKNELELLSTQLTEDVDKNNVEFFLKVIQMKESGENIQLIF